MNVIMGLVFAALGGWYALQGFGLIPMYTRPLVEPWALGCVGLFMFLIGTVLAAPGFFGGANRGAARRPGGGSLVIAPNEQLGTLVGQWIGVVVVAAFFAVIWSAFRQMGPLAGHLFLVAACLLVGGGVIITLRTTLSALRFGFVPLHLTGPRPCVGGRLSGYLDVPAISPFTKATAELKCQRFRRTRIRNRAASTIREDTAWHSRSRVNIERRPGRWRLSIDFDIPAGLPATNLGSGAIGIGDLDFDKEHFRWELHVSGDIPGVDLVRSFFVPVDAAGESAAPPAADVKPDESSRVDAVHTVALAELAAGRTIAQVVGKLESLGIDLKVIIQGLETLPKDGPPRTSGELEQQIAELKRIQAEMDSGQLMMLRRPHPPRHRP